MLVFNQPLSSSKNQCGLSNQCLKSDSQSKTRQFSGEYSKNLEELVMFLAQVAKCYPVEMSEYPQRLIELLRKHSTVIDAVTFLPLMSCFVDLIRFIRELIFQPHQILKSFVLILNFHTMKTPISL